MTLRCQRPSRWGRTAGSAERVGANPFRRLRMTRGRGRVAARGAAVSKPSCGEPTTLVLFLLVVAVVLIVGIVLAPLGAGIVVVATLILIGILGLAVWGLFFARSRRGSREVIERGRGLDTPELFGPGGPDDPDRDAPAARDAEQQRVDVGTRR
jgi:hypothetical protein